ncbi:hypothetical protein TEA_010166 [Camellia sinensis var. sinensis]|uniref:ubiquitinyl hydrolase 1 n=1 Tax=Camellia sinensis var. sinensis TaxID=542762 RepID=A0A4S4D1W4_CAMSN|nr:hypothetical protein TEA_010166 [Camellia sinensis var. sinensis]
MRVRVRERGGLTLIDDSFSSSLLFANGNGNDREDNANYCSTSDILYYEVLDIPLPELQGLKTLKVAFHHATKDEVVIYTIRLPKQSTVGDVINDLKGKVELSHPNVEFRLLEVFYHKIYEIENINDQYWTLRAEEGFIWFWDLGTSSTMESLQRNGVAHDYRVDEKGSNNGVDEVFADSLRLISLDAADVGAGSVRIPEEEKNLGPHDRLIHVYHFMKDTAQNQVIPEEEKNLGPHDRLIHVYHFMKDTAQNQVRVQNFGEPFFLVIHESETLAEVKVRIQKKLQHILHSLDMPPPALSHMCLRKNQREGEVHRFVQRELVFSLLSNRYAAVLIPEVNSETEASTLPLAAPGLTVSAAPEYVSAAPDFESVGVRNFMLYKKPKMENDAAIDDEKQGIDR